jgi:epoxyqueuosine reductase
MTLKSTIVAAAREAGFAAIGITDAEPVGELLHLEDYIREGRNAEMSWLARNPAARCNPRSLLASARSVICCAMPYRFARGTDYHEVVRQKLDAVCSVIATQNPEAKTKICVDTSPILEKTLAARAGLGWIGKHTVLVNEKLGSWFVLGEIITGLELEPDSPCKDLCGNCRACIDACPTSALKGPRELDSRLCISYLTIEHKGPVPSEMRKLIPAETYGCEICQEACPYNIGTRDSRHGGQAGCGTRVRS